MTRRMQSQHFSIIASVLASCFLAQGLSGCSGMALADREASTRGKVQALRRELPQRNYHLVYIDSTTSALASQGGRAQGSSQSEAEKSLMRLLSARPCRDVAVTGDDETAAAQALLRALYSKTGEGDCAVAFIGKASEEINQLAQAALQARLRFDWVEYPK